MRASKSRWYVRRARLLHRECRHRIAQTNSLAAGCIAGTVVAIHTRNAPIIALSAALSGVMMLGVDAGGAAIEWLWLGANLAERNERRSAEKSK